MSPGFPKRDLRWAACWVLVPVLTLELCLGASLPRINVMFYPHPGTASFTGACRQWRDEKERGKEENPPVKKQINYSIYTKFAITAREPAEPELYVVFHLISVSMSERAALPKSCHPRFFTKPSPK